MYIGRHLEEKVLEASKNYPVVMVTGQRQVGKSTMLHHIMEPKRKYITLDNIAARKLAKEDPELFFETYNGPLLIDEIQRVPELFLEIKRIVDEKALQGKENNGMFWLTSSQKFMLMKNVSESLAGRIAIFEQSGLSNAEIENYSKDRFSPKVEWLKKRELVAKRKNVHEIYEDIFRGGMPKVVASSIDKNEYYSNYVNTYLERDIKDLAQVGKLFEFYNFLVVIAARTSQELVFSDIANKIGVSMPTIKAWISLLEASGIIFLLRPYHNNISKRVVKNTKIYFMDTGLAAFLCRWASPEVLEKGAMSGAFFETYIVPEIIKSYYNAGKTVDFYYYRDIDKKEIDLIMLEDDKSYPIEIKKSKNPSHAGKSFGVLEKSGLKVQSGIILSLATEIISYNREIWLCPSWLI